MAKVELKRPVVEEIAANVKDAASVVLVTYSGINVDADTQLRKELREAGVIYKVYKNTMMNFAFKGTEFEPLCEHLNGPNAIAISKTDATTAARIVAKYAKKIPALKLMCGVVEGKFCDVKAVQELADIPSREILIGRLLGSMQSPVANFARVINQMVEKQNGGAAEAAAE